MFSTGSTWIVPLVLFAGLLLTVGWVYQDAITHAEDGEPVVLLTGSLTMESPAAWAAGCLVLWVFFFPLYLRARAHHL